MKKTQNLKEVITTYVCPGKNLSAKDLDSLYNELLMVAKETLDEIPDYQCLKSDKSDFDKLIISVARNQQGEVLGFCSSYVFDIQKFGNVLHLGLTCIRYQARGLGLTHRLTGNVVFHFILKFALFKKAWVSNVACVLSSLGNMSQYFEDVYPSPYFNNKIDDHLDLAIYFSQNYRRELYIRDEAIFNESRFIFEGSVLGNMFQKKANDFKYHHRDHKLNFYYKYLMNFDNGDEILQIGKVSLFTFPKYLINQFFKKIKPKSMDKIFSKNSI